MLHIVGGEPFELNQKKIVKKCQHRLWSSLALGIH